MKTKKKEAKFFCESCGNEVPRSSKTCPSCGKFFAAVRCPNCGRTGNNEDFTNGCPTCGYAVNPDSISGKKNYNIQLNKKNNSLQNNKNRNFDLSFLTGRNRKSYNPESSLPVWVYAFTVFVLVILIFCLYSCL